MSSGISSGMFPVSGHNGFPSSLHQPESQNMTSQLSLLSHYDDEVKLYKSLTKFMAKCGHYIHIYGVTSDKNLVFT